MIKLNSNGSQIGGKFDRIEIRGKNITIKDVVVEGEGITLYSNYNCSGLTVEDSTFISHSNNAVKLIADNVGGIVENVVFKNCKFVGGRMAVEIQNHKNTDYKINGVRFEECEFVIAEITEESSYPYGLSLSGYGTNVMVKDCKFTNCLKGIEIVGFSDVTIEDCDISGSAFSIISSNDRDMERIYVRNSKLKGMVRMTNCSSSVLANNEIECPYVEIKNSNNVIVAENKITSTGHYTVMLNQSSICSVKQNNLVQKGSNYSIVRCYSSKAKNNVIVDNTLKMKKPKKGKWWDQASGATRNIFENNKTSYFK